MKGTYIKWTLLETQLATNKSKIQTMCHLCSIQICSKQMPSRYEWSFQVGWKYNIRTNTRNSYLKLNYYFPKTSTGQNGLYLILDLLFETEFQKFWRKPKIWILSNIRSNTTIWMISLVKIYEILVDLIMLWLS